MNEIEDDPPQPARDALLRALRHGAVDGWAAPGALEGSTAADRLLDAGADRDDLTLLARAVAYEAVFTTLEELDRTRPPAGLHEDLPTADPSGRGGQDLRP
ncbi:hypothetical protein [Streptomyces sp. NRRL B-24484]|uniref:hypothetical protein n=1 Tax=Streptomyces sp. NRRL B-24484 TaxID=1463833 RepID=UPI0005BD19F3|nr:hypothetical protein [Streptomyces sp. NRRL B-24484]